MTARWVEGDFQEALARGASRQVERSTGVHMQSDSGLAAQTDASPFNVNEIRQQLGDDDAFLAEVIHLFLEDYPARMTAIASAIDARDAGRVGSAAHALKGGASNFGAPGVVRAAAALEVMAATGDLSGVNELSERLRAEVQRLVAALIEFRPAA